MLGRDTPWRQGSVIPHTVAIAANLYGHETRDIKRAVVITHDCDLPNDSETEVEVIVGTLIDKPDMQFVRARNVRRLHLTFTTVSGADKHIELLIAAKQSVCKALIAAAPAPDDDWILPVDEKRALKQWLAARYGRPAFPNAFETHLRKRVGKKDVEYRLGKALEKVSNHLTGVFFDLGENRAVELPTGEPYDLRVILVYDATEGGQPARLAAERGAAEITEIFHDAYGRPEIATEIALETCEAVADIRFSLSDLRRVDQWHVEHISLRQDPPEAFLSVSEIPA